MPSQSPVKYARHSSASHCSLLMPTSQAPRLTNGRARAWQLCQERGKPFALVDSVVYGTTNGEAALDAALALLGLG